jgi:two-component system response regulator DesR
MMRVVLAEDQEMVLSAFASLLELETDVEVVATAANGEDALEAVRDHQPDVLLTDIEMPGLSGLDLARKLADEDSQVPVVIFTTFARSGYLRRALEAGVAGYILKDAPITDLVDALRRVHRGERVVAPELAMAAWEGRDPLTDREKDVVRLVGEGLPNSDISERLHLSEGTVRNYLSSAIVKLNARNRTEAFAIARDNGYL